MTPTEPTTARGDEIKAEKYAEDLCPSDLHKLVGERVPIRQVWLYRGFLDGRASLREEMDARKWTRGLRNILN